MTSFLLFVGTIATVVGAISSLGSFVLAIRRSIRDERETRGGKPRA